MTGRPAVDVVVPVWNSARWLDGCLAALAAQTLAPAAIVFVDDASTDDTAARLEARLEAGHGAPPGAGPGSRPPRMRLLRQPVHGGFATAANAGIRATTAPLVALLNVDTQAAPDWLAQLAAHLEAAPDSVGFAASKMLQLAVPERIDGAGDTFSRYGSARKRGHGEPAAGWTRPERVLSASAGAALYRRSMLDDVGLFDESFGSYLEDVDLGLRAQLAGWECLFVPAARVLHEGGGSALPRPGYVRLLTANRAATVVKNLPGRLLLRHLPALVWGQCYFAAAYRRPLASLAGYGDFLRRLPAILRERRRIQRRRRIPVERFRRLLSRELGEPPLRRLILRRLGAR
ncbi:MAG: glycosyltransferase family 2 protein [Acidobacteriota bacterium]|nr:glycosyltransferase family 2 protein [Acidobacteriota bacterium]MDH3522127.1 glycosyltransferase family 2 protein [Acidobacteriota bacterium]